MSSEDNQDRGRDRDDDGRRDDGRDGGRGGFRRGGPGGGGKPFFRRKVCKFCTQNLVADYKNHDALRRFVTDRGKILPRRITGTCAKHQRSLSTEIKRARVLAYLPFVKK
jgi:small subunit ribosomal protein S18